MESRSQLDLLIAALVLIRRASSAIDTALGLPAADRAQLEGSLESVRGDLSQVIEQIGGGVPGGGALARRPEVRMAAGVVEFMARQGASQLGAVAGVADALRGGDSRALAQQIERRLADVGVSSREDLAAALSVSPDSAELQEALERALGSGRAEWYGPGVYGVPRGQLEELAGREAGSSPGEGDRHEHLEGAVASLERSLRRLGTALHDTDTGEQAGDDRIRALRRLADDGVISTEEFERKKAEILQRL